MWKLIDKELPNIGDWVTLYTPDPDWYESVQMTGDIIAVLSGWKEDLKYSDYSYWKLLEPPND